MFVLKFKLNRKKLTAFIAAVAIVIAIMTCFMLISDKSLPDSATCDEAGRYSLVAQTVGGECGFLSAFGYNADSDSRTVTDVVIPTEFNDTYNTYNKLQQKIGLDLNRCKGKSAKKITYELKSSKIKYAVLLTCEGKVVAAHLTNGEYGDENLPLV